MNKGLFLLAPVAATLVAAAAFAATLPHGQVKVHKAQIVINLAKPDQAALDELRRVWTKAAAHNRHVFEDMAEHGCECGSDLSVKEVLLLRFPGDWK